MSVTLGSSERDWLAQERAGGGWRPPPYRKPDNATSPKLASSIVAHSGVCRMFGFTATSTNGSAQFFLVFDASAIPANGTVPLFAFPVSASSTAGGYWGSMGRFFDRGIVICNSTAQGSLTIGAADSLFDVQYI